ncbi:MAG: hypothetical protein H6745_33455 [Deltaproteobacteria bacterium]|nr:hypothetical protein [Deltaproteobacteria bacterium]
MVRPRRPLAVALSAAALLGLAGLAPRGARAEPPAADAPTADVPAVAAPADALPAEASEIPSPWRLGLELGFGFPLLDDTDLGDQLIRFGYELSEPGFHGAVTFDRAFFSWLRVGGTLVVDTVGTERRGIRDPVETRLTRVTALAYAEATFCIEGHCERDFGIQFGLRLGAGAGPTVWTLRGEATTGAHVVLEPALLWDLMAEHFGVGLRIGYGFVWQSGLGPLDVGTPFIWSPTLAFRVLARW